MPRASAERQQTEKNGACRYDLREEEVGALTREVLETYPTAEGVKYVCFVIDGFGRYSNLGRSVEVKVFEATFGNDAAVMQEEYGPYEGASSFILIIDKANCFPVGALRIIKNSCVGLKTLVDIERPPLSISEQEMTSFHGVDTLDSCWDVGTLAVVKEERNTASDFMVSTALYRTLYTEAVKYGIEHLVSIIDQKAYENLKFLGVPFIPMVHSDYFSYLNSKKSIAVHGHVTDFFDKVDSYRESLTPRVRQMIGPYIDRLMFGTDVPEPISISGARGI
jgi:hypothetical protein